MEMIQSVEFKSEEAVQLKERIQDRQLKDSDYEVLVALLNTYFYLIHLLEEKKLSIQRLSRLFWKKSEKLQNIFKTDDGENKSKEAGLSEPAANPSEGDSVDADTEDNPPNGEAKKEVPKKKKPGHGRNGAQHYPGADLIEVELDGMKSGDCCPSCQKGKLYDWKWGKVLRLTGQAPIKCNLYKMAKVRCSLCQEIFSAPLPKEAGEKKYDEAASSMIAILKYGYGMPFYRLNVLQMNLGTPLPASTQWEIVKPVSQDVKPVYEALLWQAAQGEVIHNDDTVIEILELLKENKNEESPPKRKGRFTTGIVARNGNHKIALFYSGRDHAGENLTKLLGLRNASLPPPIQMCDALSRNLSPNFITYVAYCLLHGRRNFVDILETFPAESKHVIEKLGKVYKHDRETKEHNMTPIERLIFHQQESGPVMSELKQWFEQMLEEKKVEPNSSLGKAIKYMIKHWQPLTLFLRKAGAPLDNNLVERSLKMAILNRKNAYFYKTQNGANVGDIFMSIIQTCKLCNVNAFEYLLHLQKHSQSIKQNPHQWLPWNYKQTSPQINPG